MNNNEQEKLLYEWLSVIGFITLFWSPIERSVDQLTHFLYQGQNGNSKKKPMTLRFKLDYIKKHIPSSVIQESDLERLLDLTKKTVQIRDVCVHGMLHEFDKNSIKISKVQGKSEEHLIEIFTIDKDRLDKSASNMKLLTQHWGELVESVISLRKNG